jgi:hypothetical protein
MLFLQKLVQMLFGEVGIGGALGDRGGVLADAASLDEDLRLQKLVFLPHLTLDVVDGIARFHFRVEAKNHVMIRDSQCALEPLKI